MAKARFMSMRWLRMHLKEIIWATVILFIISCFIIGYGTVRTQRHVEAERRRAETKEQLAKAKEELLPSHLQDKADLPALHISYPTQTGSLTRMIDVKSVFKALVNTKEYKQVMAAPAQFREMFLGQIKENVLEDIINRTLLELYATVNNIKSGLTPQAIIERDKARISSVDFDRQLKREGLTLDEYAKMRMEQENMATLFHTVTQAYPIASLTDDFLKKYYEDHKLRYRKDDEISFSHLLISPDNFKNEVKVTDEEIRRYYDEHREDFKTSKRVAVRHIFIDPSNEDFQKTIQITEGDIRKYYTEHLNDYKVEEKVKARHILFRPRNTFEKQLDTFSVDLRDFSMETKPDGKVLYKFYAGIYDIKPGINLGIDNIVLIASDGTKVCPTEESMKLVQNPIKLPIQGTTADALYGEVGFILEKEFLPQKLEITDKKSVHVFDIEAAHDEEAAFEKAKHEAEAVLARLNEGADFAKLAAEFSDDIASKKDGGSLGAFGRGQMVKPFEEAAFSASVNEIVGPVRSKFGYHLIKVEEKIPEKITPLNDEIRTKITKILKNEQAQIKAENQLEICRDTIEQGSRSFVEMVKEYSMAKSRKDDGRLPIFFKGEITDDYSPEQKKILEEEIGIPSFVSDASSKVSVFPKIMPEIEDVIFNMKAGELSPVIKTSKGYHLFQLESIHEPVQMAFTATVKNKIREILSKKMEKEMARKKAEEISVQISYENFEKIASETVSTGANDFDLPFSREIGFTSYSLTSAIGQVSIDGRTYLPEIHAAIDKAIYVDGVGKTDSVGSHTINNVIGPIETELGFHFIKIKSAKIDQYTPFEEVKDELKEMLSQVPSEESIQKEFEANKEKFDRPATRKIRQILVQEESLAQELYAKLKDGEIFAILARNYSIDPSKVNGGSLPPVKKGQLPAALEEKVWNLKKGEFTEPIKTNYGWHIVQLEEDETPGQKAVLTNEIREIIKRELKQRLQMRLFQDFVTELRRKSHIVRSKVLAEI